MNKTLFKSIREYRKQSLLAPILVILEVLMEVLIPLEMAKIIDIGIANGDLGYIVQRGIVLVAMAMLALFLVYRPETWRQLQRQDMRRIFAMIFFIRCRIFLSKTLTIFQPPVWSPE